MTAPGGKKVRVMVADPNDVISDTVKRVLEEDPRMEVVATAKTGAETVRKAVLCKPVVLIMDLRFPDMGGGRVIRELSQRNLDIAVLILSLQAVKDSPLLTAALSAGAFDYILRPHNYKQIEQIGRQIITNVFVASFSKTKQIPKSGPGGAQGNLVIDRLLQGAVVEIGVDRLREARDLIAGLERDLKPSVFVVIRKPSPFAEEFAADLEKESKARLHVFRPGEYLLEGHVYIVDGRDTDIFVERNLSGWAEFKETQSPGRGRSKEGGPAGVMILESLGRLYGDSIASVVIGGDPVAAMETLKAAKQFKGLALVEEKSAAVIDAIDSSDQVGKIPDAIVPLSQIRDMLNRPP